MTISRALLTAVAVAFTAGGVRADELPVLKIAVVIDSGAVKGLGVNIPEAERATERQIVRKIGQSADFSFVRWLPAYADGPAEAHLTVTLFDLKPYRDLPSDHYVRYEAVIHAREAVNPRPVLDYGKGVKLFTTRAERAKLGSTPNLTEALAEIVVSQLATKRVHFLSMVLYKIPLTRTKPKLEDDGSVIVELPWQSLGATYESVLSITIFAKPRNQRAVEQGTIEFWKLFACGDCEVPSIRGMLKEFSCHGIGNVPPDDWKKVAPDARVGLTSHVVYMKTYIPSNDGIPGPIVGDYDGPGSR